MVRAIEFHAYHGVAFTGQQRCVYRTDRLGEYRVRAAVQQTERLPIALYRHRGDDSLQRRLGDRNAHLLSELTGGDVAGGREKRHTRILNPWPLESAV